MHQAQWDRGQIARKRHDSLGVLAQRPREGRFPAMVREKHTDQYEIRHAAHQQHHTVERHRRGGKVVLAHPAGDKGYQRQPEQQVQVRPERAPAHLLHRVQQMVMVVPVDADEHEAQHIRQEHRHQRRECCEIGSVRHLHLQHHDRDDDRDHAIAERFQPSLAHSMLSHA